MSAQNQALPPHSLEAEMAVLGSMLVERDAVVKAIDVLRPADFYKETHRLIFETILKLHNSNVEADVVTVSEALIKHPTFANIGGPTILVELAQQVPTALHVEHYAKIVHDKPPSASVSSAHRYTKLAFADSQ